jgi:heme exporter protein CcmD
MNITALFNMGSYNLYVWPAYGITLLIFGINILTTLREKYQVKKRIVHYLQQHRKIA